MRTPKKTIDKTKRVPFAMKLDARGLDKLVADKAALSRIQIEMRGGSVSPETARRILDAIMDDDRAYRASKPPVERLK